MTPIIQATIREIWGGAHTHIQDAMWLGMGSHSLCVIVYSTHTWIHKHLVTQNTTVAVERQKRAHLLVMGRYGSISWKIRCLSVIVFKVGSMLLHVYFHVWMKPLKHLSDLVQSPVCALDLKLWPDLKLLLFLLKVHQVPLVLEPGLTTFPELQKQSYCQTDFKKGHVGKS